MIKSINQLSVYELNGKRVDSPLTEDAPVLRVVSHWNDDGWVVLDCAPDGDKETHVTLTVNVRDLQAAVTNASNSRP